MDAQRAIAHTTRRETPRARDLRRTRMAPARAMSKHDHLPWPENAVDPDFVPTTGQELLTCLRSKRWRLYSGRLYKIIVKDNEDPDDEGVVLPFAPWAEQTQYFLEPALRRLLLKARQLGFTTAIAIEMLDHALWESDQRCAIVAQSNEAMEAIFRDKIIFAYDNLPPIVRAMVPYIKRTERMIQFENNSNIRVALSFRSGTLNRLHVSEFGKISAKTPKRAKEIVSGSFPAVVPSGQATIESTAEGKGGEFHKISERARKRADDPRPLAAKEWKFMFFAWWQAKTNEVDPTGVIISDEDHEYFNGLEEALGILLPNRKRAWYVLTRDDELGGDAAMMWAEHPSTPQESWQKDRKGHYYAKQMLSARANKHVGLFPPVKGVPCMGVWDIGHTDGTGLFLFQEVLGHHRFVAYIEGWEEPYDYYTRRMVQTGLVLGTQYLPHDADNHIMLKDITTTPRTMLQELLPTVPFVTVQRIPEKPLQHALVRKHFELIRWHQPGEGMEDALEHIDNYQKSWNTVTAQFNDTPLKNEATECADALGIYAQVVEAGAFAITSRRRPRRPKGGKTL
jgi:hypothetical protein